MADEKNDISDEKEVKEVEDTTDPWRNQTKTISKWIFIVEEEELKRNE